MSGHLQTDLDFHHDAMPRMYHNIFIKTLNLVAKQLKVLVFESGGKLVALRERGVYCFCDLQKMDAKLVERFP
jgi:hypothetical protein